MASPYHRRTSCRVCGSGALETVLELGPQPLANSFPRSADEFAGEPRFPLDVCVCRECLLVQTPDVVDPELLFRDYVYRTGMSSAMNDHFREYARTVVAKQQLGPKDLVVEIASNDGTLLRHFKELGVRTLGIEPARNLAAESRAAGIETLDVFFDARAAESIRAAHGPASAVIANNVLAHVDDPVGFLEGAAALLLGGGDSTHDVDGQVWVEVPSLRDLVESLEYDTIYHEHLSYFGAASVRRAFGAAGLETRAIERQPVHGGSLRVRGRPAYERYPDAAAHAALQKLLDHSVKLLDRDVSELATLQQFAVRVRDHREQLLALLRRLKSEGRSVAAYGAPAKGNTLLNWCGIGPDLVEFTVDRNPGKVGRLTPGMHLPVKAVSALLERQPDYVLILAWNLAEEIMGQQAEFARRGGRFIVPIPEPAIVEPAKAPGTARSEGTTAPEGTSGSTGSAGSGEGTR